MTHQGELIDGRYRLVSEVGRGSMGVVWRAHDERLGRVVAVKQLMAGEAGPGEAARRAKREARLAARLRHPHAVTVYDVVSHGGKPYLVMEFLPAESLSALVGRCGPLGSEVVAKVGAEVAGALAAAHAEGIVHRDVTPGNVLITQDGAAKLADFGISRAAGEATLTASGFVVGTPAYLAPEVAGGAEADFGSDVFSLGATLYFALEGAPPFGTDPNPIALLHRIAREEVTPLRQTGPLADVVRSLLRRDPAERPATPAVAEALAATADARPPASPVLPSTTGVPVPPPSAGEAHGGGAAEAVPESGTRVVRPGGTKVLPPQGDRSAKGTRSAVFRRPISRRLAVAGTAAGLVAAGALLGTILSHDGRSSGVSAGPPPAGAPTVPSVSPSVSAPPQAGCRADYQLTTSWPGGYQAQVTVRNDTAVNLAGWSVSWTVPAGNTLNVWNGVLTQNGTSVTVTNADFNAVIHAGSSTSFGFTATVSGTAAPTTITPTCRKP